MGFVGLPIRFIFYEIYCGQILLVFNWWSPVGSITVTCTLLNLLKKEKSVLIWTPMWGIKGERIVGNKRREEKLLREEGKIIEGRRKVELTWTRLDLCQCESVSESEFYSLIHSNPLWDSSPCGAQSLINCSISNIQLAFPTFVNLHTLRHQ